MCNIGLEVTLEFGDFCLGCQMPMLSFKTTYPLAMLDIPPLLFC